MLYTLIGAFIGGLITFCMANYWEKRYKPKNIVDGLLDLILTGLFYFGFIALGFGLGAGVGMTFGSYQLSQGIHPFNYLINLLKS